MTKYIKTDRGVEVSVFFETVAYSYTCIAEPLFRI